MLDIRPIILVVGIFLTTLGCAMLAAGNSGLAFVGSRLADFCVFSRPDACSAALLWCSPPGGVLNPLNVKQAFVLTVVAWLALVTYAALPFWLG